jgi:hypothetical protein
MIPVVRQNKITIQALCSGDATFDPIVKEITLGHDLPLIKFAQLYLGDGRQAQIEIQAWASPDEVDQGPGMLHSSRYIINLALESSLR